MSVQVENLEKNMAKLTIEIIFVVRAADADNRFGGKIALLDFFTWIACKIFRKLIQKVFAFDFHKRDSFS